MNQRMKFFFPSNIHCRQISINKNKYYHLITYAKLKTKEEEKQKQNKKRIKCSNESLCLNKEQAFVKLISRKTTKEKTKKMKIFKNDKLKFIKWKSKTVYYFSF